MKSKGVPQSWRVEEAVVSVIVTEVALPAHLLKLQPLYSNVHVFGVCCRQGWRYMATHVGRTPGRIVSLWVLGGLVMGLSSCGGGTGGPTSQTLSGSIKGLTGSGLVLQDSANPSVAIAPGSTRFNSTISRNGPTRFRVNGPTLHGLPAEPRFESSTRPFSLRQVFWL